MPRLFTGIAIPHRQSELLEATQTGLPDARWIDEEDFHITLRFIGDVSPSDADRLVEALDDRVWQAPEIELGELACFGGAKPRSIYASIKPNENLLRVQAGQERLCQTLGLEPTRHKFTPHVTTARLRSMPAAMVAQYLSNYAGFKAPKFIPSRYVLYSARQSTGGGPYYPEAHFPFADPVEDDDQTKEH